MKNRRSTIAVVSELLAKAADGIGLTELKGTNGRQRKVADALLKAGFIITAGMAQVGTRSYVTVVKTSPEYLNLPHDQLKAIADSINEPSNDKEPKADKRDTTGPSPKLTPDRLKELISKLKQLQHQFAESKEEVTAAEATLQELYNRHDELGRKLGEWRDEVRRALPRTNGHATYQFTDGTIYHVDFERLTAVEIKPIQL